MGYYSLLTVEVAEKNFAKTAADTKCGCRKVLMFLLLRSLLIVSPVNRINFVVKGGIASPIVLVTPSQIERAVYTENTCVYRAGNHLV